MCFKFVWKDKSDRISRKTAIKSVRNGGLGVPDIKKFIVALKLTWIRKFKHSHHKWKNILIEDFRDIEKLELYGPEIVSKYKSGNLFWQEVFQAYKDFFYKVKVNKLEDILSEPICYNERIKIGSSVFINKQFIEHGVHCIVNFLKEDGSFYSHLEFNNKYGLRVNFLTYNGCKMSIKNYLKTTGIDPVNNIQKNLAAPMQKILSISKGSKLYYDIFVQDTWEPKCCAKWGGKVNYHINWKDCFYKVQKIQDISLKWFQIRIIHRIIATNVVLKEMRVVDNDLCPFCKSERDSILHIFWHCEITRNFWLAFENWVKENCGNEYNLKLSESLIIFGIANNIIVDDVFDLILLLAKQYIYSCRYNNVLPNIIAFKKKIIWRYKIERYNAVMKQEITQFDVAWYCYKGLVA